MVAPSSNPREKESTMLIRTSDGQEFEAFDSTYEEDLFSLGVSGSGFTRVVYAVDKESLLIYRQSTNSAKESDGSPWKRYGSGHDDKGHILRCSSYAAKQLRRKLVETGEWPASWGPPPVIT